MHSSRLVRVAVTTTLVMGGAGLTARALAQESQVKKSDARQQGSVNQCPCGNQYGMGSGMMGRSYGMGPGMMGGSYGMGPRMMGGGYGVGTGMMGRYAMGPGVMGGGYGVGMGMMGSELGPIWRLDLSSTQRQQITGIAQQLHKEQSDRIAKVADVQTELRNLYAEKQPDPRKVGAVYSRLGTLEGQLAENRVEAMNQARSLLTEQQRSQLDRWRREGWWWGGVPSGPGAAAPGAGNETAPSRTNREPAGKS
jgi:Spy/CpxP family protein refolding chaperone